MQRRAQSNPKIKMLLSQEVVEATGGEVLEAVTTRCTKTGQEQQLAASGLFFAIGHEPASEFLAGQLELDEDKYIVTEPGSTKTSKPGVYAAGDVQDKQWRQAVTAAGTGCMAALEAEHFLQGGGDE